MVVIGGYVVFVRKLSLDGHSARPDSLSRVDPVAIKRLVIRRTIFHVLNSRWGRFSQKHSV